MEYTCVSVGIVHAKQVNPVLVGSQLESHQQTIPNALRRVPGMSGLFLKQDHIAMEQHTTQVFTTS